MVEEDLEPGDGALDVHLSEHAGVDLAEARQHRFRAQTHGPRPSRVVPRRRVGGNPKAFGRRAEGGENGQDIALGIEHVHRPGRIRPVAWARAPGAHAGGHRGLVLRLVAGVLGTDLEKGGVGGAAVGVRSAGGDQVGQHRGTHHIQFTADRVDQVRRFRRPPEQRRVARGHE